MKPNKNYSKKLWNNILNQAEMNMEDGTCSLHRNIVIPMMVKQGRYSELKDWEKIFFYDGYRLGKWNKDGIHNDERSNPFKDA
jgi:hypothetical protein